MPGHVLAGDPNVFVPQSSISMPLPYTMYNHTNYMVYIGPGSTLSRSGLGSRLLNAGPRVDNGVPPYYPNDIRTAYNDTGTGGGVIAIVDAFDDPDALNEFNTFSTQWGLPKETSSDVTLSGNLHFQVLYASGSKPGTDSTRGWEGEEALDFEWAHAMAPNAKIVLVEAANNGSALYSAVQVAAGISGVRQISMSWSGGESSGETSSDGTYFGSRAINYLAASGDGGAGVGYPAASPNVIGCGGTTLTLTSGSSAYVSESAWAGSGGGPSQVEPRPSYQNGISLVGSHRGVPDIACVGDPNTGVVVYSQYEYGGWVELGGTSVATPVLAGILNASTTIHRSSEWFYIYDNTGLFHDITTGNTGYAAGLGYDFTTGVGSPITAQSL
jgi:subtilase family serine protease